MGKGSPFRVPKCPREWVFPFPSPSPQHCNKLSVQFQTKLGAGKKKSALGTEFLLFLLPEIEKRMSLLCFSDINSLM